MIIAADTGGTKTLVARFSPEGEILESIKFPTPRAEDAYIRELSATIHNLSGGKAIDVITVAMPGIVKNGVAVWCNNLGWANFDILHALKRSLPEAKTILVENDANLGGLGEVRQLDEAPESAMYVTVSTGIGTAYIVEDRIDPGLRLSEGGRMPVEYGGTVQEWERFASGSAIKNIYGKYARDIHSEKTWREIADRIARGFLAIIPLTQPDIIIIGGSIGTYYERYGAMLEGMLREHLPNHISLPQFMPARDAEQAVIYGCYFYGADFLASNQN